MKMFAIIYKPTGVPVGLYVDSDNAVKRCKHLSESHDFIVCEVEVTEIKPIKFKQEIAE